MAIIKKKKIKKQAKTSTPQVATKAVKREKPKTEVLQLEQPEFEVIETKAERNFMAEMKAKAADVQAACFDETEIPMRETKIVFEKKDDTTYMPYVEYKNGKSSHVAPFAFSQYCGKIDVPAGYIHKCVSKGMIDLAEENISRWTKESNTTLMLRHYGEDVRAVVSDKYSVFDTPDVLELLSGVISVKDYKCKGFMLNAERFQMRVIMKQQLPINGEDLFIGMQWDTSDIGRATLTGQIILFKQVCTNGMVARVDGATLYKQKHNRGEFAFEEMQQDIHVALKTIPEVTDAIMAQVTHCKTVKVPMGLYSTDEVERMNAIAKVRAASKVSLSAPVVEKAAALVQSENYDKSLWGFANALTHAAQNYTLDERVRVEGAAAALMAQTPRW